MAPRIKGSLYCEPCDLDMTSHNGAMRRREHGGGSGVCWCSDCVTQDQRNYRWRQAAQQRQRAKLHTITTPTDDPPLTPRTA
jgi:hypothetical protein